MAKVEKVKRKKISKQKKLMKQGAHCNITFLRNLKIFQHYNN